MEEEEEEEEEFALSHRPKLAATLTAQDNGSSDKIYLDLSSHISEQPAALLPLSAPSPPTRHKPTHLTLRPLSLTSSANLPTPCSTPSARPGLRVLTLGSSSESVPSSSSADFPFPNQSSRTPSESLDFSSNNPARGPSPMGCAPSKPASVPSKRQSSISYIRSTKTASPPHMVTGLPTPGPTPTLERRQSLSSSIVPSVEDRDRRNTSEEIFLHQSHAVLLSRIRELEHALRIRSRPTSLYSDESSEQLAEGSELLQLVADLKADRDGLNRDLSTSTKRSEELAERFKELQHSLDTESREGALKSEKISSLESEKITLQRQIRLKDQELCAIGGESKTAQARLDQTLELLSASRNETADVRALLDDLQAQIAAVKASEADVREQLAAERAYRDQLVSDFEASGLLRTPKVNDGGDCVPDACLKFTVPIRNDGFGFQSIDSACTSVETESIKTLNAPFTLKAVEEEPTTTTIDFNDDDDDDDLAHYEDEEDSELGMSSPSRTVSSCSDDGIAHSLRFTNETPVPGSDVPLSSRSLSPSPCSSPCPTPLPPMPVDASGTQHAKHASLSKVWTFPRNGATSVQRPQEEVDHFFGCLADIEDSPRELATSDNGFRQRLQFSASEDDDLPPFILPTDISMADHFRLLDVVMEADEPERSFDEAPAFDFAHSGSSPLKEQFVPFVFPQKKPAQKSISNASPSASLSPNSTPKISARSYSPSLIPKSVSRLYQPSTPERAYVKSVSSNAQPANPATPALLRVSPPTFVQAKSGKSSKSPSPPRRKPAPIATPTTPSFGFSPSPSVESSRANVQSRNGSTFIPKLKSPSTPTHSFHSCMTDANLPSSSSSSRSSVQAAKLREDSEAVSSSTRHDSHDPLTRTANSDVSSSSQQHLLQAITNFLPVPNLPWMTRKQRASSERVRGLVSREAQLAKLRARMRSDRSAITPTSEVRCCQKCRGSVVTV